MSTPTTTVANAPPPESILLNPQSLLSDPETLRRLAESFGGFALNLLAAVVIIAVTVWASKWASRFVSSAINRASRRRGGGDATLQSFASSLVRYLIVIIGVVAAMQQLGVQATSIIAVLGAASLAVGLALQGTLSNVAAGVMLMVFRPYKVGEFVEIAGRQGTVRTLDLFSTVIASPENLSVSVPNGKAFGDVIVNFSRPNKRRIELTFGVDYDDDLDTALAVLLKHAAADPRVLKDPAPWAKVTDLADSSVTVMLRAWSRPSDYWDTRFDLTKTLKEQLEAAGLSFPYPHQVTVGDLPDVTAAVKSALKSPPPTATAPSAPAKKKPAQPARA